MTPKPTDRPACPTCGEPMTVVSTARKGPSIRVRYLGCRSCRYWRGGRFTTGSKAHDAAYIAP